MNEFPSGGVKAETGSGCSFCGKSQEEADKIVSGPGVRICDGCVDLCVEVVAEGRAERAGGSPGSGFPRPHEISAFMEQYIVGQEWAKKSLAVALYNHHKRIEALSARPARNGVELSKSNILMLGPTGSGKTLLAQTLARIIDVPLVIADATGLTEAGYMGESVDSILLNLIQAADNDLERAARGIVYIDEIDKIACRSSGAGRDVSGEGVQQALLKALEGSVFTISPQTANGTAPTGRGRSSHQALRIDTTNILFIVGGAFVGLDEVVRTRKRSNSIGFHRGPEGDEGDAEEDGALTEVLPDDLIEFGMIPEFISRLPMITSVHRLQESDLLRVLTEPKNALVKQYKLLFELDGVELRFEEDALRAIAAEAIGRGTGARGLRSVLDRLLLSAMYEVPALDRVRRVTVTEGAVLRKEGLFIEHDR
ncbi:ATP-dependent Clp protease ATP-binding subunit ClpX [Nocardiopsis sp. NPDC101807]|uniref:ATP-dependent Clp protease ATP-binding subunit ClpX n=1 Tax=Nocardiopsis sp. NPDC101807 TaxID=3364339 RepID=UPI003810891D